MHLIRKWRKENKISITVLANWLNTSCSALSQIETGYTQISGDLAIKVVQLTGLDIFELRPELKVSDPDLAAFEDLLASLKKVDELTSRR